MLNGWDEEYLKATGCVFNYRGIICTTAGKCKKCGWNPVVAAERRKKLREGNNGNQGNRDRQGE